VSEELDELLEICDRLTVIARGRLSPARPARETNAEEIGLLMSGSFIGAQGAGRAQASSAGIVDAH
jgi:general nucleoside transport system ATP-binding protein